MSVFERSEKAREYETELNMSEALWGGTVTMRDAGQAYLPKAKKERDDDYARRIKMSTLTNFFKKTIVNYTGRIMEDRVSVSGDDTAAELAQNIDRQGRDIHRFTNELVKGALRDGYKCILIDAPRADDVTNLAEEKQAGIRPYWVEVERKQILDWKEVDGLLNQVRILEMVEEPVDEFTSQSIDQVRVIEPGLVSIYRKDKNGKEVIHDSFQTSFEFIPLFPLYTSQEGVLRSDLPFKDLGHLNVEHWQKSSDQSNILHVARVPILFGKGIRQATGDDGKSEAITVGPYAFINSSDPSADMKYVEHSGQAIGAGQKDLEQIEDRARAMGADFSARKPGVVTATERAIDEAGASSELQAFAMNLNDVLITAMNFTLEAAGKTFTGEVVNKTDFDALEAILTPEDLRKMRADRQISQETYYSLFNKITGIEINAENEQELLENEPQLGFSGAGLTIDTDGD